VEIEEYRNALSSDTLRSKVRGVQHNPMLWGGQQVLIRFDNDWGASVVNHSGSYGVELAVIHFDAEGMEDWDIRYDTPLTELYGVIGWLDPETLRDLLEKIARLTPNGNLNEIEEGN
jgi:hypothetical protein